MTREVDGRRWERYFALRDAGASKLYASKEARIGYTTVKAMESGMPNSSGRAYKEAHEANKVPPVKPLDQLCPEATHALEDFGYFRERYFGRLSTPWQEEAGYRIVEFMETPVKEFTVINAPPGSGKSSLFTHDVAAWITCRNRAIRGLLGSASQNLAERYTLNLRVTLSNPYPLQAEPEELQRGLALDAVATLIADFGTFKPEGSSAVWSAKAFTVAQHGERMLTHKEPTWSAYGPGSEFIGGRYDIVIWDDLESERSVNTVEAIDTQRRMWDRVAEKRLEPGGLLVLQGQRLAPEDLYRYCLDKSAGDHDDPVDHDDCCEAEAGRKYHHIRYRAHYEDRCVGAHSTDAPYYPIGCLLDPRRLTWRELAAEQDNNLSNFQQVYQQEDADPAELLVNPIWITGGTDPLTRELFVGCWDNDRGVAELPPGVVDPVFSVATTDPSPTRMWANEWWCYAPEPYGHRYLMDLDRRAMTLPDFLDFRGGVFSGLMEDWWCRSNDIGRPITHWIIEGNAAQHFLLQIEYFKDWLTRRGVQAIEHLTTGRNKGDPNYGPKVLASIYRQGKVRLPGRQFSEARFRSVKLVDEVTRWPKGRYDDCLMAQWFLEFHLDAIAVPDLGAKGYLWRPSWLREEVAV